MSLTVIGGKPKPLILFHLSRAPRRFGEQKRLVAGVRETVDEAVSIGRRSKMYGASG